MEEHRAFVTVADGTRLAARLWLPDTLPAPVVLEALPYRMDDLTASYASEYERLCEEGGLAVCRLDIRGTGSSAGIATDEYTAQEHADICELIAWLAAQEWSNGRVGMYGASWSGFNSLQVACQRPPALGAIAPIYASDDRYTDDVHYMGGILKAVDLVDWVLYMVASNALPPVPQVFGDGWREEWQRRVDGTDPWLLRWLEEQVDGPYWRHGSVRPGYERIVCPTLLVAGWADGYTNIALRGFEALTCPKRLLLGPWSHSSPASSLPGPHIDLVPVLIRWFRRWLSDERNGIDEQPPIAVFARRSTRPAADLAEVRGEWRSEATWPPERLGVHSLRPAGEGNDEIHVRGDVGRAAWISCAGKLPWGQPRDQRVDDVFSLTYDWQPLEQTLDVMGHPRLRLAVISPSPVAYLSARVCDVFPDGTSALAARGVLNLAHRHGHADPVPLEPGVRTDVVLELEATSWVFEPGHRLRLALAGSDWPNTWPPPQAGTLVVDRGSVELELPVLDGPSGLAPPQLSPVNGEGGDDEDAEQAPVVWRFEDDVSGGETRAVVGSAADYGAPFDARVEERYEGSVGVSRDDPGSAWAHGRAVYRIAWPQAHVRSEARLELRSHRGAYHVVVELEVEELGGDDDAFVRQRRFERTIPRRLA